MIPSFQPRSFLRRQINEGPIDPVLAAVVIALIGFGVVMVYSASAIEATIQMKDPQFYLKRQLLYAVLALGLMWVTSHIDYHRYRRHTYPILAVVTALLSCAFSASGTSGGASMARARADPRSARRDGQARAGAVAVLLAFEEGRQDPYVPHRIRPAPDHGGVFDVPLLEAAGLRQRRRSLVPHVHDAVRGRSQARLPARRIDRGRGPRHRAHLLAFVSRRALPRVARHGSTPPGRGLPALSIGDELRIGGASASGSGAASGALLRKRTRLHAAIVEELGFLGVLGLIVVPRDRRGGVALRATTTAATAFGISTMFGVQALEPGRGHGHLPTSPHVALRQLRRLALGQRRRWQNPPEASPAPWGRHRLEEGDGDSSGEGFGDSGACRRGTGGHVLWSRSRRARSPRRRVFVGPRGLGRAFPAGASSTLDIVPIQGGGPRRGRRRRGPPSLGRAPQARKAPPCSVGGYAAARWPRRALQAFPWHCSNQTALSRHRSSPLCRRAYRLPRVAENSGRASRSAGVPLRKVRTGLRAAKGAFACSFSR